MSHVTAWEKRHGDAEALIGKIRRRRVFHEGQVSAQGLGEQEIHDAGLSAVLLTR